jgi:uncharacterized protein
MGRGVAIGGGLGVPIAVIALVVTMCGGDPGQLSAVLEQLGTTQAAPAQTRDANAPDPDAELVDFVNFVVDDVQTMWDDIFSASGLDYTNSRLVLYDEGTSTGCGYGTAAVGPFYCPPDSTTYLDLGFFDQLHRRFGAPGDFAQAYVIAHEIGHHVQNELGVAAQVRAEQQARPADANELSIRMELQADCFAGVWGASAAAAGLLERGDLEEGLRAAAAVGDDAIQQKSSGRVTPETWTHGSSEQRQEWFRRGFDTGDPGQCDTFA